MHRHSVELLNVSSTVSRELGFVQEQAAAVRSELTGLLEEVGELEDKSEASVAELRELLTTREQLMTQQQVERVEAMLKPL